MVITSAFSGLGLHVRSATTRGSATDRCPGSTSWCPRVMYVAGRFRRSRMRAWTGFSPVGIRGREALPGYPYGPLARCSRPVGATSAVAWSPPTTRGRLGPGCLSRTGRLVRHHDPEQGRDASGRSVEASMRGLPAGCHRMKPTISGPAAVGARRSRLGGIDGCHRILKRIHYRSCLPGGDEAVHSTSGPEMARIVFGRREGGRGITEGLATSGECRR